MSGLKWWEDNLKAELSQGDILAPLPFGVISDPPSYLKLLPTPRNGPQTQWVPDALPQAVSGGGAPIRYIGDDWHAIVISHDCAIDKKAKGRILIAQLVPRTVYEGPMWQTIVEQRHKSIIPLVDIPNLGDFGGDMRTISMVPQKRIDITKRFASMTEEGVTRLYAQIARFLFRRDLFPIESPPVD